MCKRLIKLCIKNHVSANINYPLKRKFDLILHVYVMHK